MQVNYNYNWQECIGEAGGLVQRNLWSYLESEQLLPETKTYDSFTGTWFDNGRWGNNAYVSGNPNSIAQNTGSFGGYNIDFGSSGGFPTGSYLIWPTNYNDGPPPYSSEGQCIFIQWQSSPTFTGSISLFSNTNAGGLNKSFWGGANISLGNTYQYLGWPASLNQTTETAVNTGSNGSSYLEPYDTPEGSGYNIFAWNTGTGGFGLNGTQVVITDLADRPFFIKNSTYSGSFEFTNNDLTFGSQSTFPPTGWTGPDGSQITYAFRGAVKRILIYNSTLSQNEINRNYAYLKTLP
jgi:hypothetical protein